jgi:hypothetical protein
VHISMIVFLALIVENAKCDRVTLDFLFYGFPTMSCMWASGIEYRVYGMYLGIALRDHRPWSLEVTIHSQMITNAYQCISIWKEIDWWKSLELILYVYKFERDIELWGLWSISWLKQNEEPWRIVYKSRYFLEHFTPTIF